MNSPLRSEVDRLKEQQARLQEAVVLLGNHINALERRLAEEARTTATEPHSASAPHQPSLSANRVEGKTSRLSSGAAGLETSPDRRGACPTTEAPGGGEGGLVSVQDALSGQDARTKPGPVLAVPPLLASVVAKPVVSVPPRVEPVTAIPTPAVEPVAAGSAPPLAYTPNPGAKAAPAPVPESLELRVGTYWLVRLGVVALLTALVFFGAYAYQNFVGRIGPAGKVALLYLAGGALLGAGAWLQRRAGREALRNYGQVLFAGGLAAVYFTTYAAHHFPNLRVIGSPVVVAVLLFGWAGFMVWLAERRRSEVLALFAIGLAYYTAVITRVGPFTLCANLILAAAAVFFLVRQRWARLSFVSLVATYAGYGFWRFWSGEGWHWAGPEAGLWPGVAFLGAYWLVFTAAVFLSRHPGFAGLPRATFLTLNNAAFYSLFLLTMAQARSGEFWKFNLLAGAVLLGAAALARVRLRGEPLAANTYLTQGLLLVTVGVIAKFSGMQLALLLAVESVLLTFTGTLRRNLILRVGAGLVGGLAALVAVDAIAGNEVRGVWLGLGVGALLVFNAFWTHRHSERALDAVLRPGPAVFSALGLLVWSWTLWQNTEAAHRPAGLVLLALGLTLAAQGLRLRELGWLAQLLVPAATLSFMANHGWRPGQPEPWWALLVVGGGALALVHWWQRQPVFPAPPGLRLAGQLVMAGCATLAVGHWLWMELEPRHLLPAYCALALAGTAHAALTRNAVVAGAAQVFVVGAVFLFCREAGGERLQSLPALAPVVTVALLAVLGEWWAARRPDGAVARDWARPVARMYAWGAVALVAVWVFACLDWREWAWVFAALGTAAFGLAAARPGRDALRHSAVFHALAAGALALALLQGRGVYLPNFLLVAAWMLQQQGARRWPERWPVPAGGHCAALFAAGLATWWLASNWVRQDFSGFYLTAAWSVIAFGLLAVGLALRERVYRWVGLGVLAAALGRVVILDVWRLDTLYRMVSFFALGVVLLAVGFLYNKYQEQLRRWL